MSTVNEIEDALRRITQHVRDKGHEIVSVSLVVNLSHTRPYGFSIDLGQYGAQNRMSKWGHGMTLDEAVESSLSELNNLPRAWTDADVAATLGIVA